MAAYVMACIDGSRFSEAVCDYASWASRRLQAPLTFVHVLNRTYVPVEPDFSGNIGIGAREHLLGELAALDEQRGKIAQEHGRMLLEDACQRAIQHGVAAPTTRQRNGELVDALTELEQDARLVVLGKRGESGQIISEHLGSNLERVIRALHKPILVTVTDYHEPSRAMLAFDNSATTRRGVEMLAASPLLKGLECHLVTVGDDSDAVREGLSWAERTLRDAGVTATIAFRDGDVEETLEAYVRDNAIDLIVMGAYGHSRIRRLLIGSTTTTMIRNTTVPLLLLR